jgi:uncharacterized protein with FMN-binding domain
VRRIVIAVMSTISGLVLLLSYHTSLDPTPRAGAALGGAGTGPSEAGTGSSDAGAGSSDAGAGSSDASAGSGTFTGDEAPTRWGPVQVRIVVLNGRITQAETIEYPNGNHRDQEINSWALPQLQDATVRANSAGIDTLSGATVTSQGYLASLQSALDKAHQ